MSRNQYSAPQAPQPPRPDAAIFPSPSGQLGEPDPDHHLWRNGRLFWVAFTVHLPGWQKERVRLSLGTADLDEARRRRDEVLRCYPQTRGCELSLRLSTRQARRRPMDSHGRRPFAA